VSDDPLVTRADEDGIATLSLNRPNALNALSPSMFVELRALIDQLAGDEGIRVVVLRGEGRSFCAGNDLKAIEAGERAPSVHFQAETIDAIEALPQAVIVSVRGHCFTGGLELALSSDLIIASDTAMFSDTHGRFAMVPTWGMTTRLPARIGRSRARDMMFTGRRVLADEALQLGLVNKIVDDVELDTATAEMARQIAGQSPWTIRHEKAIMAETTGMKPTDGVLWERENGAGRGPDSAARVADFSRRG
jgi:enoyl-CoA hydratase/carnithine racemase